MNPDFSKNPAWELNSEYQSFMDPVFLQDTQSLQDKTLEIQKHTKAIKSDLKLKKFPLEQIQKSVHLKSEANILISNLMTYLHCQNSVDTHNQAVKNKLSEIEKLSVDLTDSFNFVSLYLKRCENSEFESVFSHPELISHKWSWQLARETKNQLLSEAEESLITSLSVPGFQEWGNLYSSLSGKIKTQVGDETMGLARAQALTRGPDANLREKAWKAIQEAWTTHEESAASLLNSIAGWRLELYKKRSHTEPVHFLDEACRTSRISRKTLDAMMTALENNKSEIQKSGLLIAKLFNKNKMDPWDLLAPCPIESKTNTLKSYSEGLEIIQDSLHEVSPEMSNFVKMMNEKNWIEATVGPNKSTGAYCTKFAKSRNPRVYMTYMGSSGDISTLAHELGHAYHNWVLRELPRQETQYPMTLAETASIFTETLLNETLIEKSETREEKLQFLFESVKNAHSLLLNIPARFTFEKNFYEKRQDRKLSVDEFKDLTNQAWTHWYGPMLSQNDTMYWAHKLHFAITGVSFYNFPYTFGYLFGLSLYARKDEMGTQFVDRYKAILKDTGRMKAEELIQKHLNEDITQVAFWQKAIDVVKTQLSAFEKTLSY